jgi:CheY-like chemotaxis protein
MPSFLLSNDLTFPSQVTGLARQLGLELELAMNVPALLNKASAGDVKAVILDLTTAGLDPADLVPRLRALPQPPKAILAFGPHVQEVRLDAARQAGCDLVLTRGQFHARMGDVLGQYLGDG